jgi:Uma2 family endonuclease
MVLKTAKPIPHAITDLDLPDSDGIPNELMTHPFQRMMLHDSITPVLDQLHPDRNYLLGANNGIYWEYTDPPLDGCQAPDWFYIPGVPQMRPENGKFRHSYVLWNELATPMLLIEFASEDGSIERDRSPGKGKFWVYENRIKTEVYAIFNPTMNSNHLQVFERRRGRLREMNVELGTWHGKFYNWDSAWIRFFDLDGKLLKTPGEKSAPPEDLGFAPLRFASEEALMEWKYAEAEWQRAQGEHAKAAEKYAKAAKRRVELLEADLVAYRATFKITSAS